MFLEQRERERFRAAQVEAQAVLNSPTRPHAEVAAAFREKFGLPDTSNLTREELEPRFEEALAKVSPERIAEAERLRIL